MYALERRFINIGKLIAVAAVYSIILWVSIVNFIFYDTWIKARSQFAIDLAVIGTSAYLLLSVWRMETKSIGIRLIKSGLISLLMICGVLIPSLFASMFVAVKFGVVQDHHISANTLMVLVAGLAALGGGVFSFLRGNR